MSLKVTPKKPMKAVELFCGIGGFRLAADEVSLSTVWANDICPKVCAVYEHNFGKAEVVCGDIRELTEQVPSHDILTAGFPCQPFSAAGKKRGIRDPRGTLFQTVVDVIRLRRPKFFVLENVKRLLTMEEGRHFATILASLASLDYAIEWRLLNAMHFALPQNRQRVFIIGVRQPGRHALNGTVKKSTSIRLARPKDVAGLRYDKVDHLCSMKSWIRIEDHGSTFPAWGLASNGCFCGANLTRFADASEIVPVKQILEGTVSPQFDFTETTQKWLFANKTVNRFVQGVEILSNQGGGARMGYTIFGINGLAPTLTSTTSRHYERYKVGKRYRRLTNIEYARIQGFPDDHCACHSVYDQYALYGNAVPPPMAQWVIGRVLESPWILSAPKRPKQLGLFE